MSLEPFLGYRIRETISDTHKRQGYYVPTSDIQRSIIRYFFDDSRIVVSPSPRGLFGFTFRALAESEKFYRLVQENEKILSLVKEIKEIYLNEIINRRDISAINLIENHMKPLERILCDPFMSSRECYTRALALKKNLLLKHKTYVPEEVLFPGYHAEQEKIIELKNRPNRVYKEYRAPEFRMAA